MTPILLPSGFEVDRFTHKVIGGAKPDAILDKMKPRRAPAAAVRSGRAPVFPGFGMTSVG